MALLDMNSQGEGNLKRTAWFFFRLPCTSHFQFLPFFAHHSAFKINYFVLKYLSPPPSEPFELLQLDFIQMPLSVSYQYVLIVICMLSK